MDQTCALRVWYVADLFLEVVVCFQIAFQFTEGKGRAVINRAISDSGTWYHQRLTYYNCSFHEERGGGSQELRIGEGYEVHSSISASTKLQM